MGFSANVKDTRQRLSPRRGLVPTSVRDLDVAPPAPGRAVPRRPPMILRSSCLPDCLDGDQHRLAHWEWARVTRLTVLTHNGTL
jgi:hypothetical protein